MRNARLLASILSLLPIYFVALAESAAQRPRTLTFDYKVERYLQSDRGEKGESEFDSAKYLYDSDSKRALDSRRTSLPNGEVWLSQQIFDEQTAITVIRLDVEATGDPEHPRKEIVVSGRNDRTSDHWLEYLAQRIPSPSTGHTMVTGTPHELAELFDRPSDESAGAVVEFSKDNIRFEYRRDPQSGNQISNFAWSYIDKDAAPKDPRLMIAAEVVVNKFEQVDNYWIPTDFSSDVTMAGGVHKLPEGQKIRGKTELDIPGKRIVSNVVLTNIKADDPLPRELFLADVEDGHRALNFDATHIDHVIVQNKIIPKADAIAMGLISDAMYHPTSNLRKSLLFGNLVLVAVALIIGLLWKRRKRIKTVAVFLALLAAGMGESEADDSAVMNRYEALDPSCGVYSVLAGLRTLGIPVDAQAALNKQFISSKRGSTGRDLVELAAYHGAHAQVLQGLQREHLIFLDRPTVLHFHSDENIDAFDHWVLYLGCENGPPLVFDPPDSYGPISWAQLSSRWDGVGIALSKDPVPVSRLVYASAIVYSRVFSVVVVALLILWGVRALHTSWSKLRRPNSAFAVYLLLMVLFAVVVQFSLPNGIASDFDVVHRIASRNLPTNLPIVSSEEMVKIVGTGDVCIIDTRYANDFQAGAIPGAVSMPVDSAMPDRTSLLAEVARGQHIVLYCESQGCGFSDRIARFLLDNGYHNVSIYRGGYREWSALQSSP